MRDPVRAKARVIGLTAAAFTGGVMIASAMEWTAGSSAATLLQGAPAAQEVRPVAELSNAFVAISDAVTPAVVNIQGESTRRVPGGHPEIPEQFRRFFNIPEEQGEGGRPIPMQGSGSGFVISRDGYIMTNNHVVEDATRIRVLLRDRREFDAKVIGRDPTTDVAVIKIEGSDLPTVRLGDPQRTRVGEWVLAIGNPLGNLDFTVTAGIVSAKGRPLPIIRETSGNPYSIESFIQTDAAINPGNSGGPLVNIRGEVIGVNSAIASETGYYEGYGFAIPIDIAKRVADDLIRYGRVRRPILGVNITEVGVEDAQLYHLPSVAGVLVQDFPPDIQSPAEKAGLKAGDVIVGVNGQPVSQVNELQRTIASLRPGETATLDVYRGGEKRQFKVTLAEAPAEVIASSGDRAPAEAPASEGKLGIRVAPLTQERAQEYRYEQPGGIVVTDVDRFGAAGRRGVVPGLKIAAVDQKAVGTPQEFEQAITAKRAGEIVSLTVELTDGSHRSINLRMPG
jgi:serine protease Do